MAQGELGDRVDIFFADGCGFGYVSFHGRYMRIYFRCLQANHSINIANGKTFLFYKHYYMLQQY